jgi:flagellar basal-body rod protein FlgG
MITALYNAASGIVANQVKLDVLANNLANAETPGFKADLVSLVAEDVVRPRPGETTPTPSHVVTGRGGVDMTPGPCRPTGNPLDFAILGSGLFVVATPAGERFTRAGGFTRDAEGYLTTLQGYRVLGEQGPLRVPEGGVRLEAGGRLAGGDRFRIVAGPDGQALEKAEGNLYAPAPGAAPPSPVETPAVVQGHVEGSNVNVVLAMVEMLVTLRSAEAYQRTIQAADQMIGRAVNDLGRV